IVSSFFFTTRVLKCVLASPCDTESYLKNLSVFQHDNTTIRAWLVLSVHEKKAMESAAAI
ncbi:MAG: hypothetical protein IJ982_10125, partial [Fibrobacter sp.]|nr:hypothetical protein [Fibrobacter sp.]